MRRGAAKPNISYLSSRRRQSAPFSVRGRFSGVSLSLRFKLCCRRREKLAGNCQGIASSQGNCGFEGSGCQIHYRRRFMPKLKGNRLGIAADVDQFPGFEQES